MDDFSGDQTPHLLSTWPSLEETHILSGDAGLRCPLFCSTTKFRKAPKLEIPKIVEKDSETDLQSRWASHSCPPQKCETQKCETIEEICGSVLGSYGGGQDVKATCIRLSQRGLK